MLVIDDVLISSEVLERKFVCNLNACKGACCWEGDYGAPVDVQEKLSIQSQNENIKVLLGPEAKQILEENEGFVYYDEAESWGTALHPDGSCVYLFRDELGIAKCAIEQAFHSGISSVNKPISCHLYPIRVTKNEIQGFEAWNYDEWDICSAACQLGEELKVPVYQFLKEAIIRAKGEDFYAQIEGGVAFSKDV
ncbi:MAG: DUF3109 family protein [Saprospiraceae bacterium]|nr:DUF3109 family protein [Saprospiraceae bacterium]